MMTDFRFTSLTAYSRTQKIESEKERKKRVSIPLIIRNCCLHALSEPILNNLVKSFVICFLSPSRPFILFLYFCI